MGEAEIDLQTMINAAAAFGDPELLGDIQIGRWLKSDDNALVRDSAVVVAGGKVKQGVALKLQHTESGELVSSCFRSDGQRTPRCDVHVLMCKNGLGVYMSKLTDLQLKSNGMLYSGNVSTFLWYFIGPHVFDGILRKS